MKLRRTTEDYLKTIYLLSQKTEVHGAHIAEELGVSKPTVSVSLKALEREGYLTRDENHAVCLTKSLGVDHETAAADACLMEHAVSPESYEAIKGLTKRKKADGDE